MKPGLLGSTIRKARLDNKMTQEELAELVHITPTHLKHIESEHRKPSIDVLFSLASILNFSLDSLLISEKSPEHTKRINDLNILIKTCSNKELDIIIAALRELTYQKRQSHHNN